MARFTCKTGPHIGYLQHEDIPAQIAALVWHHLMPKKMNKIKVILLQNKARLIRLISQYEVRLFS